MEYLFLDIDGVLNDHKKLETGFCGIQNDKASLLNEFLDTHKEVKIVVSSAWRYMILEEEMTVKGFEYLLVVSGLKCLNKIVGCTREDAKLDESRLTQIEDWLNTKEYTNFIIIDDLELNSPNQIKTDGKLGFTKKDLEKANELMVYLRSKTR